MYDVVLTKKGYEYLHPYHPAVKYRILNYIITVLIFAVIANQ